MPVRCGTCPRRSPGCATQPGRRPSMPRPIVGAKLFITVISRPLRYSGKGLRVAIATAATTNAISYYLANKKKKYFCPFFSMFNCPCTVTSRFHGTFGGMTSTSSFGRPGSRHQNYSGSVQEGRSAPPRTRHVGCGLTREVHSACSFSRSLS